MKEPDWSDLIPESAHRMTDGSIPMHRAWFPESRYLPAVFGEILLHPEVPPGEGEGFRLSFAGVPADLSDEVAQELSAIWEWLEGVEVPSRWSTEPEFDADLWRSLDRIGPGYDIWNRCAVPLRVVDGRVYRITCPGGHSGDFQITGRPRIWSLSAESFVALVARKTAEDALEMARLRRRLDRWNSVFSALGFVAVAALVAWLASLLAG